MQMKPQCFYISTSIMTDAKASKLMLLKTAGHEKQSNCDAFTSC
jgi:hypothetical protein